MATKTKQAQAKAPVVDVHHMVRTISFTGQEEMDGALPVDTVDAHIRTWLEAGYDLAWTHQAGVTPNGFRILYIFIKRDGTV
ncbi:MAG: hypothetical protein V3W44_01960 [Dehalococcoidales bacterium]